MIATIGRETLNKSIESITRSCNIAGSTFEIILVLDNPNLKLEIEKLLTLETRLIVNSNKLGAVESFNIGLKEAKGTYICTFSDDDTWLENRTGLILQHFALYPKTDILITRALVQDEIGELVRPQKMDLSKPFLETHYNKICKLRNPSTFMMTTVVAKHEVWDKISFDESVLDHEDILWLHECQKQGYQVMLESEVTVHTSNSIRRTQDRFDSSGKIWVEKLGEISPVIQRKYLLYHVTKHFVLNSDYKKIVKLKHEYSQINKSIIQKIFINFLICFTFVKFKIDKLSQNIISNKWIETDI